MHHKFRYLAMLAVLLLAACAAPPRNTVQVASGGAARPARQESPGGQPATPPAAQPGATSDHTALDWARARIGSPYQWGGTGSGGFDCSGLVQVAFSRAGVQLPRTTRDQARRGRMVERDAIRPGDLVFFGNSPSSISHVGIASGKGSFVHASSSRGVVEDSLDQDYFSRRYVYARRVTTSAASN